MAVTEPLTSTVSSLKTDQERVVYILEDPVFILVRRVVSPLDFLLPS
jgi:hypothetical protein